MRSPAGLTAVQHIATVVALELANREREREVIRREGAETLAELLSGALDQPRRASGSRSPAWIRAAPSRSPQSSSTRADGSVVHQGLADRGVPHLLLSQRELYVLLPLDAWGVLGEIGGCSAGIGRGFSIDEGLGNARREALWALARAKDAAERLARFPEDGDDPTWLPADAASLDALVRRTLGPVIEADRRRRTEPAHALRGSSTTVGRRQRPRG